MAIIELFIVIFKTIVLSTIYTTIILLILKLAGRNSENNFLKKLQKRKLRFWLLTHFLISVALFSFSFTYWQDTGLGDNSKIPIGYGQTIQNEDFEWTYFYPDLTKTEPNKDEFVILDYVIESDKICAEVSHENTISPKYDYIVYDLKTKTLTTIKTEDEYLEYARKNNLPLNSTFYNFEKHFYEFLNARPFWNRWLVP